LLIYPSNLKRNKKNDRKINSAAVQKYSYNYWQTNTVKLGAKEIFKTWLVSFDFLHLKAFWYYQWTEIWNTVNLWCSKFDGFYGSYQTMKWNISLNLHSHEKNCKFSSIDKEMLSMNLNEFRIQLTCGRSVVFSGFLHQ
jgi:hypothetical protein